MASIFMNFIRLLISITEIIRRADNDTWLKGPFLWETVEKLSLVAFNLLFKLKTIDQANFTKAATFESEQAAAMKTMTTYLRVDLDYVIVTYI